MSSNRSKSVRNTPEAVQRVLAHIENRARYADSTDPFQGLVSFPEIPLEALETLGTLHRLDDPQSTEALPSLLLETESGQVQIEICPFGPLALLTSDGDADTDPVAQALWDAEIWPLFQNDLDGAGHWHGAPLASWLFPRRLTDALALFDVLRGA
jgi:hypothetical protein